MAALLMMANA